MGIHLTDLRSRWRIPGVLAITVESGRLAVDHVRRESGGSRVLQSLEIPWAAEALVEDPERAGRALAENLDAGEVRERRCVVCLPPGWALSTTTELPQVAAEDLRGFLELRAEREFQVAVEDLALAHSSYTLPEGGAKATLVAVPVKRLEAVRRMLASAGCRPMSISLAVQAGFADGRDPSAASLNVLVNGSHADLVVAAGGGIVALRTVGLGAAEGAAARGDAIGRELRITLGRLPDAVRRHVEKARFIGARTHAEALLESTQPHLRRLGLQGIVPAARAVSPVKGGSAGAQPGLAVEAADCHLRDLPVAFEFIEREVSPLQAMLRRVDTRRRRWVLAGVLGLLVLPAAVWGVRSHIAGRLESEWKSMSAEVARLESLQARLRQFRPWFVEGTPSVELLEGLVKAFPESGEAWAKSVEIRDGTRVTCTGFARSQNAWLDLLDRLRAESGVDQLQVQAVHGESPLQFSVTYLWGRHHDE
jgi:hypothetical protein